MYSLVFILLVFDMREISHCMGLRMILISEQAYK